MPASTISAKDDRLAVIAVSVLAYILQDVLHEGLGHGVTAERSPPCDHEHGRATAFSQEAHQANVPTVSVPREGAAAPGRRGN